MAKPITSSHPIPESVRAEQVRLLFASLPLSLLTTLVISLILSAMQAEILGRTRVLGWLLAILLVSATRVVLAVCYRRAAPQIAQSETWLWRFRIGMLTAGLVWGAAGWWLFTPNDLAHQAFLAATLVGMAAGAVSALSVDRPAAFSFILILLLPLTIHLLGGDQPLQFAMGAMAVLLVVGLGLNAHRIHLNIIENLSLRLAAEPREQALRESESRWQFALNGAGDGVWDWNTRTSEVFF